MRYYYEIIFNGSQFGPFLTLENAQKMVSIWLNSDNLKWVINNDFDGQEFYTVSSIAFDRATLSIWKREFEDYVVVDDITIYTTVDDEFFFAHEEVRQHLIKKWELDNNTIRWEKDQHSDEWYGLTEDDKIYNLAYWEHMLSEVFLATEQD